MNSCFPDELHFRDAGLRDGVRWFALEHYYRVITSKGMFTIPTGFQTDGASIPKAFHGLLGPHGEWFPAAIFHDWTYSRLSDHRIPRDRKLADALFLELMFNLGVPWWTRHTIHSAVRMFGAASYKKR